MTAKTIARSSLSMAPIVFAFSLASAFGQRTPKGDVPSAAPADQGCVNQGSDRREFAPVVCWLQQQMSWKSDHEPHFALSANQIEPTSGWRGHPTWYSTCAMEMITGGCSALAFVMTERGGDTFSRR